VAPRVNINYRVAAIGLDEISLPMLLALVGLGRGLKVGMRLYRRVQSQDLEDEGESRSQGQSNSEELRQPRCPSRQRLSSPSSRGRVN